MCSFDHARFRQLHPEEGQKIHQFLIFIGMLETLANHISGLRHVTPLKLHIVGEGWKTTHTGDLVPLCGQVHISLGLSPPFGEVWV